MVHLKRPLSIAILGTRGIPPRYGGFETFAAELSTRLAARGHDVTVYCRNSLYDGEPALWNGVRRIELPAIGHKYLETVSHAFLSSVDALRRDYDAVLLCNAANAFALPLLRAARIPVAVNVDGIERKRKKWNRAGKMVYFAGEALSASLASRVVADAGVIADYYDRAFGASSSVIAYGAEFPAEDDSDILERLGLRPRDYVLYVSRFEPENNPLAVVEGYREVPGDTPLLMVGDAPYSRDLIAQVRATADARVLIPGAIYGRDYRTLQRNALVYLQATEVGGTHPALIEAMGSGGAVLANDTPENREVGDQAVRYFRFDREPYFSAVLRGVLSNREALEPLRGASRARVAQKYGWEAVTDAYETLFRRLAANG
jgi:glycosyltransferase involved in cell wall biosynthesis